MAGAAEPEPLNLNARSTAVVARQPPLTAAGTAAALLDVTAPAQQQQQQPQDHLLMQADVSMMQRRMQLEQQFEQQQTPGYASEQQQQKAKQAASQANSKPSSQAEQQLEAEEEMPPSEQQQQHQQQEDGQQQKDGQQQQQQHHHHHQQNDGVSRKRAKPRPTHFIALQVSHSAQVVSSISSVQSQLIASEPHLQPCLLEPITAHLTIMVLNLPLQEQLDAAAAALAELGGVLQSQQLLAPLQLQLQGLSHFRHQVLYLDVAPGAARESLMALGQVVIQHFNAAAGGGLMSDEGDRGFTPHITIAKTSRLIGKRRKGGLKGRVKIPEASWSAAADLDAGTVSINEIQICSMQGRRAGQYYRVTHRLPLKPSPAAAAAAAPPLPETLAAPAVKRGPLAGARKRFRHLLSALACGGKHRKH